MGTRARIAGACLAGVLGLATACGGGLTPTAPGLLQGRSTPSFGGPGDQRAPALAHGVLAYVDHSVDETGGCDNTPDDTDCVGLLRVVRLEDSTELARAEVADPRLALGEGFVVWVDRGDAQGYGSGRVFLLWTDTGHVERLDDENDWVERDVAPVVDGRQVAWAQRWPYGTVRILDLETRTHQDLHRDDLSGGIHFALSDEILVWQSYDRSTWRPGLAVWFAEESEPLLLAPATDHDLAGAPAVRGSTLAFREQPRQCADPSGCGPRLVLHELPTGARRQIERPGVSALGPLFLGERELFWLDVSEGPYALWALPLAGGPARRITPAGELLSVSEPIATDGDWVAWPSFNGEDFDLHTGRLRAPASAAP